MHDAAATIEAVREFERGASLAEQRLLLSATKEIFAQLRPDVATMLLARMRRFYDRHAAGFAPEAASGLTFKMRKHAWRRGA